MKFNHSAENNNILILMFLKAKSRALILERRQKPTLFPKRRNNSVKCTVTFNGESLTHQTSSILFIEIPLILLLGASFTYILNRRRIVVWECTTFLKRLQSTRFFLPCRLIFEIMIVDKEGKSKMELSCW